MLLVTMQYSVGEAPRFFAATRALCVFFEVLVGVALAFFGLYPVVTFVTSQRRQRNGSCSRFELYANISLICSERASRVLKCLRTTVSMYVFVAVSAASLILLRNDERLPSNCAKWGCERMDDERTYPTTNHRTKWILEIEHCWVVREGSIVTLLENVQGWVLPWSLGR